MAAQVEEMAVSATLLAKSAEQLHQAAARFRVDKEEAQITSRRRQSDWNSETAGKAQGNHTPKLRVVNRLW